MQDYYAMILFRALKMDSCVSWALHIMAYHMKGILYIDMGGIGRSIISIGCRSSGTLTRSGSASVVRIKLEKLENIDASSRR